VKITACILIRNISYLSDLLGGDPAKWEFDANHLNTRLSLTVYASNQAKAAKFIIIKLSIAEKSDLLLQIDDVARDNGVV
jgi:hypothetical protein